jgi:hypothetical protein
MPHRHLAQEAPVFRAQVRLPDGTLGTMTMSANFRLPASMDDSPEFRAQLTRGITEFWQPHGVTVLAIEQVANVSLEFGQ